MKKSNRGMIRRQIVYALLIALFIAGYYHSGILADLNKDKPSEDVYDNLDVFVNALSIIQRDYVDETKAQELIYGALKGMTGQLDPHSQFLDQGAYKEMQVDTEGKFGGLGIEVTIRDNVLTVVTALDGTPADLAGILANDRIVKIDDESTRNITLQDAVKKLRGKVGTEVVLTILRGEENSSQEFKIVRDIIKVDSITSVEILEGNVGYVRMSEFQERSADDLVKAIQKLEKEGMEYFILDLRNNPGGLLQIAVDVSDLLLPKGSEIVSTRARKRSQNVTYKAKEDMITEVPLIIMVNAGSASASEIVAGAIQDLQRGIVLGKKSFGKGSVQSVIPLKDGSALKITTAKYFTPNGTSIQGKGIEPDIIVDLGKEELQELKKIRRSQIGQFQMDSQIQAAVDLFKGIKIFQHLHTPDTSNPSGTDNQDSQEIESDPDNDAENPDDSGHVL
ncbi:MAG: S41 family peptidase [Chlamydiota bacterium]|nr:S41 family peptidase [Chlamydiota bacterium]